MGSAWYIALAVWFLARAEANYTTGTETVVDGGCCPDLNTFQCEIEMIFSPCSLPCLELTRQPRPFQKQNHQTYVFHFLDFCVMLEPLCGKAKLTCTGCISYHQKISIENPIILVVAKSWK
ncbi:hypothetical protein BKA64DRAFT_31565 [Cadophora sp. MPI-SDFR-AT-0126]|nr:hypothetical protein BKA64DRAFT_31565 [Leotiomycetes sp. MPI-SDFR-AT-0126]